MNITGWQTILCSTPIRVQLYEPLGETLAGRDMISREKERERERSRESKRTDQASSKSRLCVHSAGLLRTTIPKSNCRPLPPPPRQDFIMACIHNAQLYTRKRNILSSEGMSWTREISSVQTALYKERVERPALEGSARPMSNEMMKILVRLAEGTKNRRIWRWQRSITTIGGGGCASPVAVLAKLDVILSYRRHPYFSILGPII
jgi:hypothetical protein